MTLIDQLNQTHHNQYLLSKALLQTLTHLVQAHPSMAANLLQAALEQRSKEPT